MNADIRQGLFAVVLVFAAVCSGNALAQGFAGLGGEGGDFAPVLRGVPLQFPADHGPHLNHRIEWWYLTANLKDANGASYGVQWTLFRQAMKPGEQGEGWANSQIWMAHAAVTTAGAHKFSETFARGGIGQAGVEASPFRAWIDSWQLRSLDSSPGGNLAPAEVTASGTGFSYTLKLATDRPLVLQGDAGYSKKSERGQASYYYSQPYLDVSGVIKLDGKAIDVTGQAWIDREWSSQPLASDQTGWDWFALHLESGEKVMLFRLRHADGKNYFSGNWISADGKSEQIASENIAMTPTAFSTVAGRQAPTHWDVAIAERGLKIVSVPLNPKSWMGTSFPYWEGPIRFEGSHRGQGYLEMTGY